MTVSGKQTVTLSFIQKGSVTDCNKDFSALFKNSSMNAKEHFSLTGGKKVDFSDKIVLPSNVNDEELSGHYIFASINPKESVSVSLTPSENVKDKTKQNTSTKTISTLINSDENVHDLCDFELTGNNFQATYHGSTTASFWMNALKWGLPVVVLLGIILFLYRKKAVVLELFCGAKKVIVEKVNEVIERINKL